MIWWGSFGCAEYRYPMAGTGLNGGNLYGVMGCYKCCLRGRILKQPVTLLFTNHGYCFDNLWCKTLLARGLYLVMRKLEAAVRRYGSCSMWLWPSLVQDG